MKKGHLRHGLRVCQNFNHKLLLVLGGEMSCISPNRLVNTKNRHFGSRMLYFFHIPQNQIMVKTKASKKSGTAKGKKAASEPLLQPKCRNCSGFEEKLSVTEQNHVKEELSLMQKHEIIRQMSSYIGTDTRSLTQAEELFEAFKYMIAEYVVKHEFNCESKLSVQMVLWLEQKCQPAAIHPLHGIIGQYLQKRA